MIEPIQNQQSIANSRNVNAFSSELQPALVAIQRSDPSVMNFATAMRPLRQIMERDIKEGDGAPAFYQIINTLSEAILEKAREYGVAFPPLASYLDKLDKMSPAEMLKTAHASRHHELDPVVALGVQINQLATCVNDLTLGLRKVSTRPECLLDLYAANIAISAYLKRDYSQAWSELIPIPYSDGYKRALDFSAEEAAKGILQIKKLDRMLLAMSRENEDPDKALKAAKSFLRNASEQIASSLYSDIQIRLTKDLVINSAVRSLLMVVQNEGPSDFDRSERMLARPRDMLKVLAYTALARVTQQSYDALESGALEFNESSKGNFWNQNFGRDTLNGACRLFNSFLEIPQKSHSSRDFGLVSEISVARSLSVNCPSNEILKLFAESVVDKIGW